jgi:Tol biopolymer transport system component
LPDHSNPLDWSADGRWILFGSGETHSGAWIAPTFGNRKPFEFLADRPFAPRLPRFSPDGKWIAYHSNESGRFEVYARPFSGAPAGGSGKIQISEHGGFWATWSRNGKELFFIGPDSKLYAATVASLGRSNAVSSPIALFEVCPGATPNGESTQGGVFDVAPDSEKFLFVCESETQDRYSVFANWRPK